jgi:hypothetical protein
MKLPSGTVNALAGKRPAADSTRAKNPAKTLDNFMISPQDACSKPCPSLANHHNPAIKTGRFSYLCFPKSE